MSAELAGARAALFPKPKDRIKVQGKLIRYRLPQMLIWGLILGACGAALVAGGYFLSLQVDWGLFYLKDWWDNLFASPSWELYRHAERDLMEPAIAAIAVKTLLVKPKAWAKRAGPWRTAFSPFIVIIVASALIAGGVYLMDFLLPNLWHRLFGGFYLHGPEPLYWLGIHSSWEQLLLGGIIGVVVAKLWMPAGATLQGAIIDRSVDNSKLTDSVPIWVKYPLAPPQIRERWSWQYAHDDEVTERGTMPWWAVVVTVAITVVLIAVGFTAHYYIAKGGHVPFLAP